MGERMILIFKIAKFQREVEPQNDSFGFFVDVGQSFQSYLEAFKNCYTVIICLFTESYRT